MAKEWTKVEWNDELSRIASDAAKYMMEKKDFPGYSKLKIESIQKEYIRKAKEALKEKYPFDKIKDTEKDSVARLKGEDAAKFLGLTGGNDVFRSSYDPLLKKKMDDFAKLGPLVLGLADEGRDWYNMGATDLFAKGEELGYDTKSKKGKMDFLRDIGDVQQAHDRGKLLEEFNKESNILTEMYYPTMMEEMRKQISTGRGSTADVVLSGLLDIGINRGMAYAPSVSGVGRLAKMPVRGAAVGAAMQGGLEAARQGAKTIIDDELEADLSAPLLATTLGATRPGMIGTVSTVAQQIPGNSANRFAAGVSAATRAGNPVYAEREGLEHGIDLYSKLFGKASEHSVENKVASNAANRANKLTPENAVANQRKLLAEKYGDDVALSDLKDAKLAKDALAKAKALYAVDPANNPSMAEYQKPYEMLTAYGKPKFLTDYDNISNMKIRRNPNNFLEKVVGPEVEVVNGELRPGDYLDNLEKAFPAKMAEAYGNDKWYKRGVMAGQILGDIGGRIEPMLKFNPFGPLSGGQFNITGRTDYKETPWYKSLSKKQQEAFDDAYEKSKKESE